ncbi:putative inorganic carbon transporter subunit DabA, partial [Mycobacterium sp. THU-M116]
MTTVAEHVSIQTRRARLRSEVNLAARVVPTHYPLETFIAVNPLAGLESMPFEQAVRRAGDLYGVRGVLDETTYRHLYRRGRITDADLDSVLRQRYPALLDGEPVRMGDRSVTPAELLRADLLHGEPAAAPERR